MYTVGLCCGASLSADCVKTVKVRNGQVDRLQNLVRTCQLLAENDWRGVWRPQVAMHSLVQRFYSVLFANQKVNNWVRLRHLLTKEILETLKN